MVLRPTFSRADPDRCGSKRLFTALRGGVSLSPAAVAWAGSMRITPFGPDGLLASRREGITGGYGHGGGVRSAAGAAPEQRSGRCQSPGSRPWAMPQTGPTSTCPARCRAPDSITEHRADPSTGGDRRSAVAAAMMVSVVRPGINWLWRWFCRRDEAVAYWRVVGVRFASCRCGDPRAAAAHQGFSISVHGRQGFRLAAAAVAARPAVRGKGERQWLACRSRPRQGE